MTFITGAGSADLIEKKQMSLKFKSNKLNVISFQ